MSSARVKIGVTLLAACIVFANIVNLDYNWRYLPQQGLTPVEARAWSLAGYQHVGRYLKSRRGMTLAGIDVALLLGVIAVLCWPRARGKSGAGDDPSSEAS